MRVLIIEDHAETAALMELMLKAAGFNAYVTDHGEDAVELAKLYDYDLITLDLGLPDIGGLEVLRQIRIAKVTTPILMVTGEQSIDAKVKTLGGGADDFLSKPFHRDELVARAHALVRRSKGHAEAVIKAGPISVLLDQKRVEVNGERIHLTGKEYGLLELLALRKGAAVTKDMVLNHLYGGMDEPGAKIIDVFISKLRTKLRAAGADGYVETVWGHGYALSDAAADLDERLSKRAPRPEQTRPFRILATVAEKPRTFPELAAEVRIDPASLRYYVSKLTADALIKNIGVRRAAIYEITSRGRERLQAISAQEAAAA